MTDKPPIESSPEGLPNPKEKNPGNDDVAILLHHPESDGQESSTKKKAKGEVTITFQRWHIYAILMPLVFGLGLGIGYLVWGRIPVGNASEAMAQSTSEASTPQDTTQGASDANQQVPRYDIPVDDDPAIGPEDAPITIVEFSDYECPYCRKWHDEVFTKLQETYPEQVRLVYRDFPLSSIHANAVPAAEAANCANEQGKFWPFHENLFSMELGLSEGAYEEYASRLGLNVQSFLECLESDRYQAEVQADYQFAADLGVRSTPTFFINGIAIVGAQPFEVFQQVIEKELAGEIP
jgi:protein-disulfide isomerase